MNIGNSLPWNKLSSLPPIRFVVAVLISVIGIVLFMAPRDTMRAQESQVKSGPAASKAPADPAPPEPKAEVSFRKDILPLFKDQKCIVCHRGENPSGLDLAEEAYQKLVNIKSIQDKAAVLVKPGDLDASYFYQKLIGPGKEGAIMPPKGKMDEAYLNKIAQWIKQGALNN